MGRVGAESDILGQTIISFLVKRTGWQQSLLRRVLARGILSMDLGVLWVVLQDLRYNVFGRDTGSWSR